VTLGLVQVSVAELGSKLGVGAVWSAVSVVLATALQPISDVAVTE